jgi:Zn-finger nucleic acid-binding protein
MAELETRWPCPVCLGVKLEKLAVGADGLVLDHCPRCGGMWFELGEVQTLGGERRESLWEKVERRDEVHQTRCHSCRAYYSRDDDECPVCGTDTRLDCPMCDRRMDQVSHDDLTLDVCKQCRGVWFDHHELDAIWSLERDRLVARYREQGKVPKVARDGSEVLLETLIWAPDLAIYGAYAAGRLASAAFESAPEIVEAVSEAAGGVFETIVEIIAGIFG